MIRFQNSTLFAVLAILAVPGASCGGAPGPSELAVVTLATEIAEDPDATEPPPDSTDDQIADPGEEPGCEGMEPTTPDYALDGDYSVSWSDDGTSGSFRITGSVPEEAPTVEDDEILVAWTGTRSADLTESWRCENGMWNSVDLTGTTSLLEDATVRRFQLDDEQGTRTDVTTRDTLAMTWEVAGNSGWNITQWDVTHRRTGTEEVFSNYIDTIDDQGSWSYARIAGTSATHKTGSLTASRQRSYAPTALLDGGERTETREYTYDGPEDAVLEDETTSLRTYKDGYTVNETDSRMRVRRSFVLDGGWTKTNEEHLNDETTVARRSTDGTVESRSEWHAFVVPTTGSYFIEEGTRYFASGQVQQSSFAMDDGLGLSGTGYESYERTTSFWETTGGIASFQASAGSAGLVDSMEARFDDAGNLTYLRVASDSGTLILESPFEDPDEVESSLQQASDWFFGLESTSAYENVPAHTPCGCDFP